MTYKQVPAPHFRTTDNSFLMCLDVLVCMVPLCVLSAVYYGWRPILIVLLCMATAVACETICCMLMRRPLSVVDGSALATGAIVGAVMSPMAPYWLGVVATAFAILVVKMPMGGTGRNLFNPAAGGLAFVTLCFPSFLFTYPITKTMLPVAGSLQTLLTQKSPAAQLAAGASTHYNSQSLLLGDYPGPIGATAVLVLLACAVYLFIRRSGSPAITISYLVTCALLACLFPRASDSVITELCSGYLLFAAIFMFSDPVTAPRYWFSRVLYGVLSGVLVMLFRYMGRFEEGVCFAVLLANAAAPIVDRNGWRLMDFLRLKWASKTGKGDLADDT